VISLDITIDDIINRINELLEFNGWSVYRLAKEADLPPSSLNNIFNRKTFPSIPTLQKICNGFEISLSEFFNFETKPLRNYDISEEEQRFNNLYRGLSKRKKEILMAYAKGLSTVTRKE